jgi:hypothetical protein
LGVCSVRVCGGVGRATAQSPRSVAEAATDTHTRCSGQVCRSCCHSGCIRACLRHSGTGRQHPPASWLLTSLTLTSAATNTAHRSRGGSSKQQHGGQACAAAPAATGQGAAAGLRVLGEGGGRVAQQACASAIAWTACQPPCSIWRCLWFTVHAVQPAARLERAPRAAPLLPRPLLREPRAGAGGPGRRRPCCCCCCCCCASSCPVTAAWRWWLLLKLLRQLLPVCLGGGADAAVSARGFSCGADAAASDLGCCVQLGAAAGAGQRP